MKKFVSALLITGMSTALLLTGCQINKKAAKTNTTISEKPDADTADKSEPKDSAKAEEKTLTPVTLNEVAHSIFYAPQYVAIEEGYFTAEGIELTLETGYGADKTMTAVLSGDADIGFMGSEASIYAYLEGANDPVVNFAQLTQRAGNFLVAREEMPDFKWEDLKGKDVLGGRKGVIHTVM